MAIVAVSRLLYIFFLFSVSAVALTPSEQNALDTYIGGKNSAALNPEKARADIVERLNKLDAEINPIVAICKNGQSMLVDEEYWLSLVQKNLDAGLFSYNPYNDKAWKVSAVKSAKELCCSVRNDPEWQREIIDRFSQGLPPLSGEGRGRLRQQPQKWPGAEVVNQGPAVLETTPVPQVGAPRNDGNREQRTGRGRRGGGGGRGRTRGGQ